MDVRRLLLDLILAFVVCLLLVLTVELGDEEIQLLVVTFVAITYWFLLPHLIAIALQNFFLPTDKLES